MKLVKVALHNKMGDEFLEREFATNIDSDSITDDFYSIKGHTARLK